MKRREFTLGALSLMIASQFPLLSACSSTSKKLNVLLLGGTNFLGPAIVNALLTRGHKVTLFNRGITNPQLFPELQKLRGDREMGIKGYVELESSGPWDLVVDVWPDNPRLVKDALEVLEGRASHYMFVSSIAVYHDFVKPGIPETAPVRQGEQYEPGNYNLNKRLCERLVEEYMNENFTIVRPGAIVGDRDSGPFATYLLNRIANQAKILAPNSNDPVQYIDAADIASFITLCAEENQLGYYNLVGPTPEMGYKDMILAVKTALNSNVEIIWMDIDFLLRDMKLEPFMEIPFWIPVSLDPEPGFFQISNKKALAAGLKFTDFVETVRVCYDSFKAKRHIVEENNEAVFGISPEREAMIIEEWQEKFNN